MNKKRERERREKKHTHTQTGISIPFFFLQKVWNPHLYLSLAPVFFGNKEEK